MMIKNGFKQSGLPSTSLLSHQPPEWFLLSGWTSYRCRKWTPSNPPPVHACLPSPLPPRAETQVPSSCSTEVFRCHCHCHTEPSIQICATVTPDIPDVPLPAAACQQHSTKTCQFSSARNNINAWHRLGEEAVEQPCDKKTPGLNLWRLMWQQIYHI